MLANGRWDLIRRLKVKHSIWKPALNLFSYTHSKWRYL